MTTTAKKKKIDLTTLFECDPRNATRKTTMAFDASYGIAEQPERVRFEI
jgi:hypothetical protein